MSTSCTHSRQRQFLRFGGSLQELREHLHQEIENKAKQCSNSTYECTIPRVDGHEYCMRHILCDPSGNFRQCTYTYPNGRKCPNALQKHDIKKDPALTTLCFDHNRQAQLQKTHTIVGKLKRIDTNEVLLNSLAHHVNVEDVQPEESVSEQDEEIDVVSPHVAPFVAYDQVKSLNSVTSRLQKRRRILDYASDSSSEDDNPPNINNTARGFDFIESDNESVDSQAEDMLKHAGIYTREEALRISEAKLTKLQGLYINQINRLHHTLKERRRRYLLALRKEREMLCSIHDQLKDTPRERQLYDQLKALNTYHRRYGVEAVLHKKFKEKRSRATEGYTQRGPGYTKCVFTEGGVKCGERAMPCCKFCRKHILEDKKQILFRACEVEKSGVVCQEPIPCIFDDASTCVLHLSIPPRRQYIQKKEESETEEDEFMDAKVPKLENSNSSKVVGSICEIRAAASPARNITISHDKNEAAEASKMMQ
ncbi:PREDICTED: KAT8 regulatory NSL complex subunit 2-like isoform X1 [Rhagoletis zephyria]|uniref:KAT8 regulatory NSL complex subunit 2-like isoform X1 n=1 Tax=Rhagoletis zephyria TaxID=28612 RepID=UPI000811870C|nr:PREDICTED: KAT8 regulatory NSL complex subunit 2-like isoform X1 [Rhagoletis zephyria]